MDIKDAIVLYFVPYFSIINIVLCFLSVFIALVSYYKCKYKKNAYGLTPLLYPFGIYVWGDGVVFGIFWCVVSLVSLLTHDAILFLIFVSVFWLVRSIGETMYWFMEQFTSHHRNAIETLPFRSVFHNDSIWFVFQIANQCLTVITIITTVYLFHLWLP